MKLWDNSQYWTEACGYCKGYPQEKCYCSLKYKLWRKYKNWKYRKVQRDL